MKSVSSVLGFFLAVVLLYGSASAMMVGLSTEELTNNSQAVIRGTVEDKQSYWSSDGKMILTKAFVRVNEVIRQKANGDIQSGSRVAVEYLGGEVNGLIMKVSAVSPLSVGEDVVLFVNPSSDKRAAHTSESKTYNIFGFAQGKYSIGKDGIAKKEAQTIINKKEAVDNNIPAEELTMKIKGVK